MPSTRTLDDALNGDGARLYCISESGAYVLPLPAGLEAHAQRFDSPAEPLDVYDPASFAVVISAFLEAITEGYGTTAAQLVDGTSRRVEIFNRIDELGCVAVCLAVTDEIVEAESLPEVQLPARRVTSRMDGGGRSMQVDGGITRILGWSQEEYLGLSSIDKVHPDDHVRAIRAFAELLGRPGGQSRNRQRVRHKDGSWRWFEITHTNLLNTDEPHIFAESFDISDEMQVALELQEREALLGLLTESLPVGVLHLRPNGEPDIFNSRWSRLTGTDPAAGIDDFLTRIANPEAVRRSLTAARNSGVSDDVSVSFIGDLASYQHADLAVRPLPGDTAPFAVLLTLTDMSESISTQADLLQQAHHDHLTGVLNRLGIEERISRLLTERASRRMSLLYCDLDDFKAVNDTYGHSTGDAVLEAVATEIRRQLRPLDLVARLGGDEFLVVLPNLRPAEVDLVRKRIEDGLSGLTTLFDDDRGISATIGSADVEPGDTFDTLVQRADAAMYRRKSKARSTSPD